MLVMVLGVGSFAHSIGQSLADAGADVSTYLTRNYGHFSPSLVGETFSQEAHSNPVELVRKNKIDFVMPQSIDWAQQPWAEDLKASGAGIFSPVGEAMRIERERDFARKLCADFGIPFPQAYVASNRLEAEKTAFHKRVRTGFLVIAKAEPKRVKVIDSSASVEQTFAATKRQLDIIMRRHE